MKEKFLPVGTVVRLFDGKKNIVVNGFCVVSQEDGKLYDYVGCLYPEGMLTSEFNLLFNHEQIQDILHMGFVNEEEKEFKLKLNSFITQKQTNGGLSPKSESTVNNNLNDANTAPQPVMFGGNQNPTV